MIQGMSSVPSGPRYAKGTKGSKLDNGHLVVVRIGVGGNQDPALTERHHIWNDPFIKKTI